MSSERPVPEKCAKGRMMVIRVECLLDMMGGKPSSHFNDGSVSHTLTCGRASTNDIHVVCYYARRRKA